MNSHIETATTSKPFVSDFSPAAEIGRVAKKKCLNQNRKSKKGRETGGGELDIEHSLRSLRKWGVNRICPAASDMGTVVDHMFYTMGR